VDELKEYQGTVIDYAVKYSQEIEFPTGTGHRLVKIVNSTVLHLEIGLALCKKFNIPFSVVWKQRADHKFVYLLTSLDDEYDVETLAKAYGGSGSKNQAIFVSEALVTGLGKCFEEMPDA